jgi:cytochrome c
MDSFELNKVLGAILAGSMLLLCVHLLAGSIFAPVLPAKPGYKIVARERPSGAPVAKVETVAPIATRLAEADVSRGKSISKVCMTCHTLAKGAPNKIGPNLWNVVDRPRASEPGFDYSAAMRAKGGKWSFDELDKFLTHPQGYIPGTKMTFGGIDNAEQRGDLIAYLRTLSDHPAPLPEAAAATPASSATTGSARNPPHQHSLQKRLDGD